MAANPLTKGFTTAQLNNYNAIVKSKGTGAAANWAKNQQAKIAGVKSPQNIVQPQKPVNHAGDINPDGSINYDKSASNIVSQAEQDYAKTFRTNNPDETDQYGNTRHYSMNADGTVSVTDSQGKVLTDATNNLNAAVGGYKPIDLSAGPHVLTGSDLADQHQKDYDAVYGNETQYLDKQRTADLDAKKQELAQRGIVYDPAAEDPNSQTGYGKALRGITQSYDQKYHTAANDAQLTSDTNQASTISASSDAYRTWLAGQTSANDESRGNISDLRGQVQGYTPNFAPFQGAGTFDTSGSINSLKGLLQQGKISQQTYDLNVRQLNMAAAKAGKVGSGSRPAKTPSTPAGFQID